MTTTQPYPCLQAAPEPLSSKSNHAFNRGIRLDDTGRREVIVLDFRAALLDRDFEIARACLITHVNIFSFLIFLHMIGRPVSVVLHEENHVTPDGVLLQLASGTSDRMPILLRLLSRV